MCSAWSSIDKISLVKVGLEHIVIVYMQQLVCGCFLFAVITEYSTPTQRKKNFNVIFRESEAMPTHVGGSRLATSQGHEVSALGLCLVDGCLSLNTQLTADRKLLKQI